jgi:hypothetical protein
VEQEIVDVPSNAVGEVVQTAIDNGSTRVFVIRQDDGKYTVRYR